jgi:hypothetical protein
MPDDARQMIEQRDKKHSRKFGKLAVPGKAYHQVTDPHEKQD